MVENNVEKRTQELVGKIITDLGYELYDVEYLKEGKEYHLCIYIDKPEGISIEDCEKVNNEIDSLLDKADFNNQNAFEGLLKEYNDDFKILDGENSEIRIEKNKISSAKSLYDWNEK